MENPEHRSPDPLIVPACPTPVHPDQLRQDWPVDPAARDRIVAYLASLTVRGATEPRRRNGQPILDAHDRPVLKKITPRLALRAMRSLAALGGQALEQQRLDRLAQVEDGRNFCLKDHVTESVNLAGQRLTEEADRRGLSCAAELDLPTQQAICDAAEAELAAEAAAAGWAPEPEPPPPARLTDPAQRRDWVIPALVQAQIMTRLIDMIDPHGVEAATLSVREQLMAVSVLGQFERLSLGQQELDRMVRSAGPVFDLEARLAEIDEAVRLRLIERKREDEEMARRRHGEVPAA